MKEVDDIGEVQSFYEMMLDQHGEACKLYNFKKDWAFRWWCDYFHELEKHLKGKAMERFIFCTMCKVQCKTTTRIFLSIKSRQNLILSLH